MMNTAAKILLLVLSLTSAASPPMLYDADVKSPVINRPIMVSEGTTPLLRFRLLNDNALVVATNYTGTLYLSETWDSDAVIVIPSTAAGTNYLDFQCSTTNTATNGTFKASLVVSSGSETVEWARGVVELMPNPGLSGAGVLDITNPFAFAGLTYSGAASDGPYKAGSGISFSAPDGRGRVAVNATGALPDVMLASVYDTDEDDVVDNAEAVGGTPLANLATDAEVAAAVASVHPALTLKAGSVGALVGQELEISPAMVATAMAGTFVNLDTGGTITGVDAQLLLSGGSSLVQAANGAFDNLNVNATPVLTTSSTLNADNIVGTIPANSVPAILPAVSGANLTDVLHASSTLDATKLSGALPALDGAALTGLAAPQWAVEWGPGEIVGPFYDGSNDAAGWSRKAEVNGTYPTGISGMGMSSTLTTLQDVTIYVHRHTPKAATALDTNAAFEITFWTTTASSGDQKFDLTISGSNRSGGSQTTVYTKTGIVGGAGVVTTLVIPVGAVSYYETSAGTVTNQAESLSSSTLYRMYTFKIVTYSKNSNRVNFVGGVVNGR